MVSLVIVFEWAPYLFYRKSWFVRFLKHYPNITQTVSKDRLNITNISPTRHQYMMPASDPKQSCWMTMNGGAQRKFLQPKGDNRGADISSKNESESDGKTRDTTGDHQRPREATGGNRRQQEATEGNGRQRRATRGNGRQRRATGGNWRQRAATGGNGRQRRALIFARYTEPDPLPTPPGPLRLRLFGG